MAKYTYKAISNGVLNDPYRYIEAGKIVESETEIKARWLLPVKEADALKPLPLTSSMNFAGSAVHHITVPPIAPRADYDAQMEQVIANEKARESTKATTSASKKPQE